MVLSRRSRISNYSDDCRLNVLPSRYCYENNIILAQFNQIGFVFGVEHEPFSSLGNHFLIKPNKLHSIRHLFCPFCHSSPPFSFINVRAISDPTIGELVHTMSTGRTLIVNTSNACSLQISSNIPSNFRYD